MIKEHCRWEFINTYKKRKMKLKQPTCCSRLLYARIEYYPGYGVRLSCMCGESVLVLKREMFPDIKTEEDFVCMVVEKWNNGEYNW